MNFGEVWQEYDCPIGADSDLYDEALVWRGKEFYCHWCGQTHLPEDVGINTYRQGDIASGSFEVLPLPNSEAELRSLISLKGMRI